MPRLFGASGSVRASSRHQSACQAPLAQLLAVDDESITLPACRRPQAGQIGPRLGLREPLAPDLAVEDREEVPLPLLVGACCEQRRGCVVDRDEGEDEAGRVVGRELLVEHDLLRDRHAPPHSAGQCGTAYPAPRSCWNQSRWKATKSSSGTPLWASRHRAGTCARHHARTSARKSSRSVTRRAPLSRGGRGAR